MKKATELPNKFAGLIKQPPTKKQERQRAKSKRAWERRKRLPGKATNQNERRPTTERQVKSH
jgi:uncharacterized protein (DUF2384 family)